MDSEAESEVLHLNVDAPNGDIGYGSISGNGSDNNSVSAVVGSEMSDTVDHTVDIGVNASSEAVSGGDTENPSKVTEGTGSSGNVGMDSGSMLGRRRREDEGGDVPGDGWMEPSKRKKPRGGASSGLVRGRGGAVLKKQGARTETSLPSSKNGFTRKLWMDVVATPREKDSSPPETETMPEPEPDPESSHTAAGTYAVATESCSGKGKGKGRAKAGDVGPEEETKWARAEDGRAVVGSEKTLESRTAGGDADYVGKRVKGVSNEEASEQESIVWFGSDFERLKSVVCLRIPCLSLYSESFM